MSDRQNLTGRPPLTPAERMLLRTRALMQNKGHCWSKAMIKAENSVKGEPPAGYEAGPEDWASIEDGAE